MAGTVSAGKHKRAIASRLERLGASTRKILECVPDGNFAWKPHDKSMTLGRLASHVADLPNFLKTMVTSTGMELTTSGHKPFAAADPAELLAHFAASAAAARSAMTAASEDDLAQTWTLTFKGNPVFGGPRTLLLPTTLGT